MSNKKVKEIDVWIYKNHLRWFMDNDVSIAVHKSTPGLRGPVVKAKLVIEVPEKKIELTESELRDCFDSFRHLEYDHERRLVYSFYEFSKKKLFGDAE
jgi:hypothetical protein